MSFIIYKPLPKPLDLTAITFAKIYIRHGAGDGKFYCTRVDREIQIENHNYKLDFNVKYHI